MDRGKEPGGQGQLAAVCVVLCAAWSCATIEAVSNLPVGFWDNLGDLFSAVLSDVLSIVRFVIPV
jgi:hypothetical protein